MVTLKKNNKKLTNQIQGTFEQNEIIPKVGINLKINLVKLKQKKNKGKN